MTDSRYEDLIRDEIRDRARDRRPITVEEWDGLRLNSYEREVLFPKLTNFALGKIMRQTLHNLPSPFLPPLTYEHQLKVLADLAASRLERS